MSEKLNILIIDDEPRAIVTLKSLIERFHPDLCITGVAVCEDAIQLNSLLKQQSADLLFLDIEMPGGSGIELLKKLGDLNFQVIFTTAHDQYAMQAIKASALDYLLKPIDKNDLDEAIAKFRRNRKNTDILQTLNSFLNPLKKDSVFEKLAVPTTSEVLFIPIKEILYLESDSNYTIIHLLNKNTITSSKNIGHYEQQLEFPQFMRIHNSYIVNISRITKLTRGKNATVLLETGKELEVSQRRRDELQKQLGIG